MSFTKEQKKFFLKRMNQEFLKNKPLTKEQKLQIWSEAKAKYGDITFSILEIPMGLLPIEDPFSLLDPDFIKLNPSKEQEETL